MPVGFLGRQPQRFQDRADDVGQCPFEAVGAALGGALQRDQRLLDFLTVEKPLAAADLIGDARLGQRFLVDLGLGVHPVQDGDLGCRGAGFDQSRDRRGHRGGFRGLVGMFVERRGRARLALTDQLQLAARDPAPGGRDHLVGQRHHLRSRPVVALEPDDCGVRKPPGEVQQVARRGPGERVDGLVGVADDGEVVAVAQPGREHPLLQRRDVLVLVDDKAAVAGAELLGHRGVVFDGGGGVQQQIVEVEQGQGFVTHFEGLVRGVDARDLLRVQGNVAAGRRDGVGVLLGADQRRLRPFDLPGQVAHVVGAGIHPGATGGPGHNGELAVQQLPSGVADHPRPEVPQLAHRGGMERQRLHGADTATVLRSGVDGSQPGAHLTRGTLGECHRQHLAGGDMAVGDQLRDPVRDGAGLACSGAREHTDRTARSQHGLALLLIQSGGQWVCDHRHGVHLVSDGRQTGVCRHAVVSPRGRTECSVTRLRLMVMTNAALTMFTTTWCGYCHRLKTALKASGISYDEVDIERDAAAAEFVGSVNDGNRTVPTVKFADGSTMTNPSARDIKAKLAEVAG